MGLLDKVGDTLEDAWDDTREAAPVILGVGGAVVGGVLGGPAGAMAGYGIGSSVGGLFAADKAASDARREQDRQLRESRQAAMVRSNLARNQMVAERRRMSEGPSRIVSTPRDSTADVSVGSLMTGLGLGQSTGLIVPVAS